MNWPKKDSALYWMGVIGLILLSVPFAIRWICQTIDQSAAGSRPTSSTSIITFTGGGQAGPSGEAVLLPLAAQQPAGVTVAELQPDQGGWVWLSVAADLRVFVRNDAEVGDRPSSIRPAWVVATSRGLEAVLPTGSKIPISRNIKTFAGPDWLPVIAIDYRPLAEIPAGGRRVK